ncbi:Asp-tRNA(Asn)/Glu-tRNA(Gln) amidotransferase subunit GatB [Candidatus Woesearchaeota archaeon]|nr:MAG: Asp-tRNA(Asn)/Glu-tRNA(Gln) amidotransferase subunit GatB [Candidatus Woesearchaeota archaeon]
MVNNIKIGLEIHCQLNTKSKLFCGCENKANEEPNTLTCPVCLGHPGAKPVLNKQAVMKALKVALAMNCQINPAMVFSRKSYFFPDLPNNFQVTQYEFPLAGKGFFDGITIKRLHIEEDPGKLIHKAGYVLVDYNRSGVPLIEIVTEPELTSADRAKEFLRNLIWTLEYLDVYERESESSLRCDVNISINNGSRVEVKNVNGMNDVKRVIEYEVERQQQHQAVQETRGWDSEKGITYQMRTKENEDDYGYITEPNLPMFEISNELMDNIKVDLAELPLEKIKKYIKDFGLSLNDAEVIASDKGVAELFEKVSMHVNPVRAAKWIRQELVRHLSLNKVKLNNITFNSKEFIKLLKLFFEKKITDKVAKDIMKKLIKDSSFNVEKYIKDNSLTAVSDESEIESLCDSVISSNPKAVEDYKSGQENALNFLMGQVMKLSKGKASPDIAKEILKRKINK